MAMADQSRNLNGHAASRVAAILWNERYAAQGGGLMDFWDTLRPEEKRQCADLAKQIREARPYTGVPHP